jgi:hypothetical protein
MMSTLFKRLLVGCYLIIYPPFNNEKRTSNFEDVRAYVVIVHAIDENRRLGETNCNENYETILQMSSMVAFNQIIVEIH